MTNAIEMTNISLHFPKGQGLLSGLVNAFRDNNSVKNRYTALEGIDLQVHQGEVLGVIGRNGSGKSTLLRIMAGIYRPDQGQVKVRGATSLLAGVNVGFNQNLTGRENVHLYGSILGHRKEKIDEILPDILEFSEIGEFMDQPLRTYSSGMKARCRRTTSNPTFASPRPSTSPSVHPSRSATNRSAGPSGSSARAPTWERSSTSG